MTIAALCIGLVLTLAPGEPPPATAAPANDPPPATEALQPPVLPPAAPLPAAEPLPVAAPAYVDMAEFDAAVQLGQWQYDAGEFLAAARTWRGAADELPRTPDQRGNVVAIHGSVAEAYDRAVAQSADPAVLREALAVLDAHAAQFTAAYPGVPLPARVESIRAGLRQRPRTLDAGQAVEGPERGDRDYVPPPLPWRPMAIGGGAALAGGLALAGVFVVGLTRAKAYEGGSQSSALVCEFNAPGDACANTYDDYRAASTMTLVGMIGAPALIGAGVGMLVVAAKRKRAAEQPVTPVFAPGFVGLGWQRRF